MAERWKTTGYQSSNLKAPALSGALLKVFARLSESWLAGYTVLPKILHDSGFDQLLQFAVDEDPTFYPSPAPTFFADQEDAQRCTLEEALGELEREHAEATRADGFHFKSVLDFAKGYRDQRTTPSQVVDQVLRSIRLSDDSAHKEQRLRAFVFVNEEDARRQAAESTARFARGEPLSVFDGVPVGVKDEVDVRGYATMVGTSWINKDTPTKTDAEVVRRLRAAGAIIVGKTNMHEVGIGITGANPSPLHGTARNAYDLRYDSGGSSSGSGSAVGAGLCPVAIGADGGGSIRVPAAMNGVVGLKPSYGRLSERGAYPLCWSVAHLGPLAGNAVDCALAYYVMADGADPLFPASTVFPRPSLKDITRVSDLSELSLGVYSPWFEDSDGEVVSACRTMVEALLRRGAVQREVTLNQLVPVQVAHGLTITTEMRAALERGGYADNNHHMSPTSRCSLAVAKHFTSCQYVAAQRIRSVAIREVNAALRQADVIVTPALGCKVPKYAEKDADAERLDMDVTSQVMRFMVLTNFSGHPAITFPVGYDGNGLPIAMQAIGNYGDEHVLLRLAFAAETILKKKAPGMYFDVLDG